MKRVALWLYILLFATISVVSWVDSETRGTPAQLGLDLVLSVFAVLGMVFYAKRIAAPHLIAAWKVVAPLLLIGNIILLAWEWPDLVARDPDLTVTEHRVILGLGLMVAAAFVTPAIVINFRFAQSRHLLRNPPVTAA